METSIHERSWPERDGSFPAPSIRISMSIHTQWVAAIRLGSHKLEGTEQGTEKLIYRNTL
jgi:hypothetical protein